MMQAAITTPIRRKTMPPMRPSGYAGTGRCVRELAHAIVRASSVASRVDMGDKSCRPGALSKRTSRLNIPRFDRRAVDISERFLHQRGSV